MRHAFETHSSEPNFKFSCIFCTQTFRLYSSMVSHLNRKHKGESTSEILSQPAFEQEETRDDSELGDDDVNDDMDDLPNSHELSPQAGHHSLHRAAALFLLTLKEKYRLTQTAVNFSVFQVQQMVTYALEDMRNTVQQHAVRTIGAELPELQDIISIDPFEDLQTEHMQTKYFREHFDLTVGSSGFRNMYILLISH